MPAKSETGDTRTQPREQRSPREVRHCAGSVGAPGSPGTPVATPFLKLHHGPAEPLHRLFAVVIRDYQQDVDPVPEGSRVLHRHDGRRFAFSATPARATDREICRTHRVALARDTRATGSRWCPSPCSYQRRQRRKAAPRPRRGARVRGQWHASCVLPPFFLSPLLRTDTRVAFHTMCDEEILISRARTRRCCAFLRDVAVASRR